MAATTTAVGSAALSGLTSGTDNVALGKEALTDNSSGSENVAVGSQAGSNNVSGGENVIVGYDSAPTLTSGSSNIIIGASADVPTSSTSNYLNIGGVITGDMSTGAVTLADGFMATTQSPLDSSTKLATTAYVDDAVAAGGGGTITLTGDVTGSGTGSFATTIKSSVNLSGSPTTTTQTPLDDSTKIATTAYVDSAVAAAVASTASSSGSIVMGAVTIQWGTVTITTSSGAGTTGLTFGTAFSGTPYYVGIQGIITSNPSNFTTGQELIPAVRSVTSTGFTAYGPTSFTGTAYYLAIGPT